MPPPPPPLIAGVMAEILLRLPPDEPDHLFRAALVCKPWLRILCDLGFLRSYRAFHGAPPLLGLLHRLMALQGDPVPRLAPTTSAPLFPYQDRGYLRALDCRHGRVLLHVGHDGWHFVVWDPVTGDEHRLEEPAIPLLIYSAAVLCAVPGCDHHDCHGGPFRVVFVVTDKDEDLIKATVYSSETGACSTPVTLGRGGQVYAQHMGYALDGYYTPYVQPRRGAVIGDAAYFTLRSGNAIVKYDWTNKSIFLINPPKHKVSHVALMVMEDSSLGFAYIERSSLYLWSRKVMNAEESPEWVQCRSIEMEGIIPVTSPDDKPFVVGCAEGVGAIFISTGAGLFTFRLHSGLVKKVDESGVCFSVLPHELLHSGSWQIVVASEDSLMYCLK